MLAYGFALNRSWIFCFGLGQACSFFPSPWYSAPPKQGQCIGRHFTARGAASIGIEITWRVSAASLAPCIFVASSLQWRGATPREFSMDSSILSRWVFYILRGLQLAILFFLS